MTFEELVLETASSTSGSGSGAVRSVVRRLPLTDRSAGTQPSDAFLLFLGELSSPNDQAETVLSILLEVFERGCQPPHNKQPPTPVELFEQAVGDVNTALSSLAGEGHVFWVGSLHVTLALIQEQELHFVRSGEAQGLLLREKDLLSLTQAPSTPSGEDNPLKTFQTIVSGQIQPNDRLLFATPQLFDFLSMEKLRRLLLEHSVEGAKRELSTLLTHDEAPSGLLALALFEPRTSPASSSSSSSATPTRSFEATVPISSAPASSAEPVQAEPSEEGVSSGKTTSSPSSPASSTHASFRSITKSVSGVTSRGTHALRSLKGRFSKPSLRSGTPLVPKPKLGPSPASMSSSAVHRIKQWAGRIQRLPRSSQFLLGGATLLVLVLCISLVRSAMNRSSEQEIAQTTDVVTSIEQTIKQASDTLLFQDDTTALELLRSSEAQLQEAQQQEDSPLSEEQVQTLQTSIQSVYDQIDKITRLPDLSPSVALSNADIRPVGLLLVGSERLLFTQTDIYAADASGALSLRATRPEGTQESFVRAFQAADGGAAVLLGSEGSLFSYDPTSDRLSLLEQEVSSSSAIQGGGLYNNNLYVIHRGENQVLKYTSSGDDFSSGIGWISDGGVSLENASDVMIDGSIFVLFEDGSMQQYLSGTRQPFDVQTPSAAYVGATHLAGNETSDRLALLDPTTQRIGVFSKETGVLLSQYESPVFANAIDLTLSPDGSTLTILTSDGWYDVAPE